MTSAIVIYSTIEGMMNQSVDDTLQRIKEALCSIVDNIDPNENLDGPCLALENFLQSVDFAAILAFTLA